MEIQCCKIIPPESISILTIFAQSQGHSCEDPSPVFLPGGSHILHLQKEKELSRTRSGVSASWRVREGSKKIGLPWGPNLPFGLAQECPGFLLL